MTAGSGRLISVVNITLCTLECECGSMGVMENICLVWILNVIYDETLGNYYRFAYPIILL